MNYLLRHMQVLLATLGQMARAPLATLLTLTVIGITLALPSGLYVMLDNLERLSAGWDRGAQASLFLKRTVTEAGAHKLAQQIRAMSAVAGVDYISREAALVEFKKQSGFGTALNALDS
ncbi:MAG TPA: permease-like cell division protein FtsX, partial [Acidiferrobacterales bacterium]|nr:permease-like cell division protein FtsX [Acidiferrobacterales bacterium]